MNRKLKNRTEMLTEKQGSDKLDKVICPSGELSVPVRSSLNLFVCAVRQKKQKVKHVVGKAGVYFVKF